MMRKGTILGQQGILREKPPIKFKPPNTGFEIAFMDTGYCRQCGKKIGMRRKLCSNCTMIRYLKWKMAESKAESKRSQEERIQQIWGC
jgi:hypothetical protein